MFRSLYIHIPFCTRKCFYCDFATASARTEQYLPYIKVLQEELSAAASRWTVPPLETIYLGGGTPSLLSIEAFQMLFDTLRECFSMDPDLEWTMEASPDSLEEEKLTWLRSRGVNRLSIGVQSFHNAELAQLGRTHTQVMSRQAYVLAREAGFDNISFDLIFALPEQTLAQWIESLEAAIALRPDHFSLYNLMIEEGTYFYRLREQGKLTQPPEETEYLMYREARERLAQAGYEQYEISSFALPGKACRHNKVYWYNQPYLGVGVGAHSWVGGERFANVKRMAHYMHGDQVEKRQEFSTSYSKEEEMKERLFMGFRLLEGVVKQDFYDRFDQTMEATFGPTLAALQEQGLIHEAQGRYALTEQGIYLANLVFAPFA